MPHTNNPLFSVIVPAYNVGAYIARCIESVLDQSYSNFELILVDDGSTDNTGKICDKYVKAQSNIKVIHQPNAGLSAARNVGIAAASGEYLVLLDGDDYLEETALEVIQNNLEPNLDLLRFQAQEVFADGRKVRYEEPGFATMTGPEAFVKLAHYHYTENAWLYAYRREFFIEHNFQYAEGCIAEDFGLTPLIIASARKVKVIPDICYDYRQRTGSIMHNPATLSRRTADIAKQLKLTIPKIAKIPDTASILHFLVASFLTEAARLNRTDFLKYYQEAKTSDWLRYVHPGSLKALPRAFLLKHFPGTFYKVYHR